MIVKILLENFMSHARTEMELCPGLNVLVGPNNCGKSALVAALRILAHNENSTYVTRHGQKFCGVTLTTSDGHTIQWSRKNSPKYKINGQDFDRLKSGAPPELHSILRMPIIECESDEFDIHFGEQKKPIFLLDKSHTKQAQFFASSSDASQLLRMQKRHKDKESDAHKRKARLEAESRQLSKELESLGPVVGIAEQFARVTAWRNELALLAQRHQACAAATAALARQRRQAEYYRQQTTIYAPLAPPPLLHPVEPLSNLILAIRAGQRARAYRQGQYACLQALPAPPQMRTTSALGDLCANLHAVQASQAWASAQLRALRQLSRAPQLADTHALATQLQSLKSVKATKRRLTGEVAVYRALVPPPEQHATARLEEKLIQLRQSRRAALMAESRRGVVAKIVPPAEPAAVGEISTFICQLRKAHEQLAQSRANAHAAERQLAQADLAIRAQLRDRRCPTCGAMVDAATFLEHATPRGAGGDHA
ncbi:MAG: AAA family ATPase [Pirellulales bacterium]|nr:AAA family ATPase [Pirellulales bacterium]